MKTLIIKKLNKSIILAVLLALPAFAFAQIAFYHQEITPGGTIEAESTTTCLTDSIWDPISKTCKPTGPYPTPTGTPIEIPIRYTDDISKYKDSNVNSVRFNLKVGEKVVFREILGMTLVLNRLDLAQNVYGSKANVTVTVPGGCGPNADPRCLGFPGFEDTFDLILGIPKAIPGTGASLTFAQEISDKEAAFIITTPFSRPTPTPTRCPPGLTDAVWDPVTRTCKPAGPYPTSTPSKSPRPTPTHISVSPTTIKIDTVTEVREVEPGSYEIKGKQEGKLFFLIPVEIDVSYSLKDSTVTDVKMPWWNLLVQWFVW